MTRTYILCVHSVLLIDSDIFRECFFSFASFFLLAPLFAAPWASCSALFLTSSPAPLGLLLALIRKIESADNVGAKRQACLIACLYAWKRGGGSQELMDDVCLSLPDFGCALSGFLVFGVCVVGNATNVGVETVVEAAVGLAGDRGKSDTYLLWIAEFCASSITGSW